MIIKGKKGIKYEIRVVVDKIPSSDKYRTQGTLTRVVPKTSFRPKGGYDIIGNQKLTFNKRKDADEFAKQLRKTFKSVAKDNMKYD